MVSKTREKFIEVARQLFARKGVENTTMNDIASASDKGRRTIYTYFKSKREIFNAVIQSETDQLVGRLTAIVASSGSPNISILVPVFTSAGCKNADMIPTTREISVIIGT